MIRDHLWYYSPEHGQPCQVIETQTLWGDTTCRVWLPRSDSVVRIPASNLKPLEDAATCTPAGIAYVAAAARVADALTQDVLFAPIESSVIPLPHQIRALSRAIFNDRVRYLLADEVGLGKTIEAGLIMRELKLRGFVRRTLVVVPRGLVAQWVSEMRFHFNEEFHVILPDDLKTLKRISPHIKREVSPWGSGHPERFDSSNPWRVFSQVVVPIDSFKPLEKRRGWSKEDIALYNRERFEDLIAAGWDLIIVDEAHRLGGSTDQVARHKLGRGLAEAAPYLLLLSATPHQGKTDAFHRLILLLDPQAFPDVDSVSQERVQPYVIRTEKRRAIDAQGNPLFTPRKTQLVPISWGEEHRKQRVLYDAVTQYVRTGYNRAMLEKKTYIGFLMILMQRLVTSSTRAIRTTLERRLDALRLPQEQLSLFPGYLEEEWVDLDGQEQVETLLRTRLRAMTNPQDSGFGRPEAALEGRESWMASVNNERAEVKLLLQVAKQTEESGSDVKAAALLDWIYQLQREEGNPELKTLVFTEFIPTQEMLRDFLKERAFSVVCLNGSMGMEERSAVQEAFAKEASILISTDAGGEGLNLQFCHVVVNYDIPWNPMRLEQRIGRVDRIGQARRVYAINFVLEDTVEFRVRQVLEEKLEVILNEFGVDKTGDVLDSAYADQIFDDLYIGAIVQPGEVETKIETAVNQIREQVKASRENLSVLGEMEDLDPREAEKIMAHPLPHWVERMTTCYLQASGGRAERNDKVWSLTWPGGDQFSEAVFTARDAELHPSAKHLTLEDHRICALPMRLPRFVPGQPIPCINLPNLPIDVKGLWSLWRISLRSVDWRRQRVMPLFIHDDGRNLAPTARFAWDQLLSIHPRIDGHVKGNDARQSFERARQAAETHGKATYDELLQIHRERLLREREKVEFAFAVRRRAIERIGLPTVRSYRLAQLEKEEQVWREDLKQQSKADPDMVPLILIRLEGKNGHG